jgi:hypothetical protein
MASVVVEPGRDGIPRIRSLDRPLDPAERCTAIATVMLSMAGLVVATLMPAPMLAVAATCCAAAEIAVRLRTAALRREVPAEVLDLARARTSLGSGR